MTVASLTLDTTRATLGGVALFQAVSAVVASRRRDDEGRLSKANAIGAMVCTIAASVYHRMRTSGADVADLRHADWLITCPLMLWELYVLLGIDVRANAWSFSLAVAAISVCIVLGRVAASSTGRRRALAFGLATAAFALLLASVCAKVDWARGRANVAPLAFLATWALYPLAFWEKGGAAYNVLDLVSKGAFGLYVGGLAFGG